MQPLIKKLAAARAAVKKLRSEMKKVAKKAVAEVLAPAFEKYPDLKSVTWTQYTPSFNDGDPCTFRSGHKWPELNEYEDEDGRLIEGDAPEGAYDAAKNALSVFDNDDMYTFFGNGKRVTVTREGVKVEDHDCGY